MIRSNATPGVATGDQTTAAAQRTSPFSTNLGSRDPRKIIDIIFLHLLKVSRSALQVMVGVEPKTVTKVVQDFQMLCDDMLLHV